MPDVLAAVRAIAGWPELAEPLEEARAACARLRFHEGLRRRIPEAAAESRVRGAWADARLDGARVPLDTVRDLAVGATRWPQPSEPTWDIVRGSVQVVAEAERVAAVLATAPAQALARLHVAAATPLHAGRAALGAVDAVNDGDGGEAMAGVGGGEGSVGRPRIGPLVTGEFATLPAPPADVGPRLEALTELLRRSAGTDVPVLLVAAMAHGEVALVRPFDRGNGLVARALERALSIGRGLDSTGVSVPEFGHAVVGATAYAGALSAYAQGTREGLGVWIRHCATAVTAGAAEGERIAQAVRSGRLDRDSGVLA